MRHILTGTTLVAMLAWTGPAWASPYPLEQILPKAAAERLAKVKVNTSNELLQRAASAKDRAALAKAASIPVRSLQTWAKMCDLLRIKGVGPEMVRLLNAGRVSTVKELKAEKAKTLLERLMRANAKRKLTQNPPSEQQLATWITQAAALELVLR